MLGYVRVVIDEKGKPSSYFSDSVYYPDQKKLACLKELFESNYQFDFTGDYVRNAEALVTFKIQPYPSNNPLDPIEYDFELDVQNVIELSCRRDDTQKTSLPAAYIAEATDTHDPFDIYLHGL